MGMTTKEKVANFENDPRSKWILPLAFILTFALILTLHEGPAQEKSFSTKIETQQ